jgi:transcriptional regulator with XRE-family HTH domain
VREEGGSLSDLLRRLRKAAGLNGHEAAARAGISQSKVSRFENGIYVPTEAEAGRLAQVYNASGDDRARLVAMARDLVPEQTPARVVLSRGAAAFQQRIGRIERASEHVRSFNPAVVPGLLQTPDYARAIFAAGDILGDPVGDVDGAVEARMQRQELLAESGPKFTVVMSEGVLRWQAGSPQAMEEQLRHIEEVQKNEQVRVGIIPFSTAVRVFPLHGFDIYDRRAVIVGTETATALLTERADVEAYERLFTELEQLASFDDAASSTLARVASEYRALA